MWFYFFNPQNVPAWILVFVFCGYFFLFIFGTIIGFHLQLRRKNRIGIIIALFSFFYLGFLAINFKRFWQIGTLAQFHQRQTVPLLVFKPFHLHPLGLFLVLELLIAIIWLILIFHSAKQPQSRWNRKEA